MGRESQSTKVNWSFALGLLAAGSMAFAQAAPPAVVQPAESDPKVQVQPKPSGPGMELLIERLRQSASQTDATYEVLLGSDQVSAQDKATLEGLRKRQAAALEAAIAEVKASSGNDAIAALTTGQDKIRAALKEFYDFLRQRLDLYHLALVRAILNDRQGGMFKGESAKFLEELKSAGLSAEQLDQSKKVLGQTQIALLSIRQAPIPDKNADAVGAQRATMKVEEETRATLKSARQQLYAIMTPPQRKAWEWHLSKQICAEKDMRPLRVILMSSRPREVAAPLGGQYELLAGRTGEKEQSVAKAVLKAGQTLGFRVKGEATVAFAGDQEFGLPADAKPGTVYAWEITRESLGLK